MSAKQPTLYNWLTLVFLSIVWGSSFILMKKGLVSFSPVQVATLRISIAFLVFLPYIMKVYKNIPKEKLKTIFFIGLLGSFVPAFLFAKAQTEIDSAPAGILNSLTPLFTYLWGIFLFSQPKSPKRLLGIGIGFLGAIILIIKPEQGFSLNIFALLILLATILYGLSGNLAKYYLQQVDPKQITAISFLYVGIAALTILGFTDFISVMQTDSQAWLSLLYVAILSLVGTAFALMLFWKLIQDTDAIFGSMTTYFIPVVAILWGLLDGEQLSWQQYLGFGLIVVSVFLVKSQPKTSEK